MVGLVVVSHSAKLAEGVAELVNGMGGSDLRFRATGGVDLPGRPLGTDAVLVLRAIEEVYSSDGVLVLMDLGSALLSAELALEMLPPDRRAHVVLCEAPVVEGAVAAAVQARLGSTLEKAAAEARGALAAKAAQLGVAPQVPDAPPPETPSAQGQERELRLTVRNRLGIHARPAARFVQTASRFAQADVRVRNLTNRRGPVSAKSINSVTTLGVRQGHDILLTASGLEAQKALDAFRALAEESFGDLDTAAPVPAGTDQRARPVPAPSGQASRVQGLPVSPGIAIGPARPLQTRHRAVPEYRVTDPQAELEILKAALARTRGQIAATRDAVARRTNRESAAIFEAHLLYLDDEALLAPSRAAILEESLNAVAAWKRAFESVAAGYRELTDEYLRARAADVEDVGWQVLSNLLGTSSDTPTITEPGVLVAADLTPADTARLDPGMILGIGTAFGGPTSHSAILARALGIPAVAGLGEAILGVKDGTTVVLDGEAGLVYAEPAPALLADYSCRAEAERSAREEARASSAAPAVTRDGRRVEVVANVGSAADALSAVRSGAEGAGLFRTEFLFLDRRTAPGEEDQYLAYRAVAEAMGGRPLIIRTLDAGGDKPLPYLDIGAEANPFLGWRAIRICLAHPDLFKTQLRAIVRVAAEFPVKVMFPMIATLGEWRAARSLLEAARAELLGRGQAIPPKIEAGIMVEVPSAAVCAAQFAPEVDFFSVGTNDLTQYTLAAERGHSRLAGLSDAFQPAVVELMRRVVDIAHAHGKWVGVCGEMAGDPAAIPLLVGLGIDELSMSAPAIPRAKQIVRALDYQSVRALALSGATAESPEAIRALFASTQRVPRSQPGAGGLTCAPNSS